MILELKIILFLFFLNKIWYQISYKYLELLTIIWGKKKLPLHASDLFIYI